MIHATLLVVTLAGQRLLPVDEAAKDPSFAAFRATLLREVRERDAAGFLAHVDPKIRVTFGDRNGIAEFRKLYRLPSRDSKLWPTMERLLTLGATRERGGFWAPYVYSKWPQSVDPYENVAVVRPNEPLLDKPNGKPIARLNYDIVHLEGWPKEGLKASHRKVKTASGKVGYVSKAGFMTQVDHRAFFEKVGGKWRLTTLVAGD